MFSPPKEWKDIVQWNPQIQHFPVDKCDQKVVPSHNSIHDIEGIHAFQYVNLFDILKLNDLFHNFIPFYRLYILLRYL